MSRLEGKIALLVGEDANGTKPSRDCPVISNERAIARECAREGAAVMVADVGLAAAETLAAELRSEGFRAAAVSCDVMNAAECQKAVGETVRTFGAMHLLANTAGPADLKTIDQMTAEEFESSLRANILGHFHLVKHALPEIERAGGGSIVNISSLSALRTGGAGIGYETSKAALLAFTRNVALSAAKAKIRVNCVLPGVIDSAAFRSMAGDQVAGFAARVPLNRLGTPAEFAKTIVFLFSDDSSFITGTGILLDGGMAGQI
jgi:NAD(P)-dependent dehydrogenase (short-subunit alcohol dehydrogenase family)